MGQQLKLNLFTQLIVDLFAGGGGMSEAMQMAWGRSPDIAVNHNDNAISMHRVNHPNTRHFLSDVFEVDPRAATQGRQVGWLHLSPDCTDHSQASAGQPRNKKIRGLSWVGYRWAAQTRPVIVSLENVKQILSWTNLIAKRDKETGRALKRVIVTTTKTTKRGKVLSTSKTTWEVAVPGERVPVQDQYLIPDPKRIGETWRKFVRALESLGYHVEVRLIRNADMGGHTTRERLFMIARCDGQPILWDEISHHKKPKSGQMVWKPAHEIIDFSIRSRSIFNRKKPLAPNTLTRIAKGIEEHVLKAATPFIVPIAHYNGQVNVYSTQDPLRTVMASTKGGEFSIVTPALVAAPALAKFRFNSSGSSIDGPVPAVTAGGKSKRDAGAAHALGLLAPILVQAGHGEGASGGVTRWGKGVTDICGSVGTIMANGGSQALGTATLAELKDVDSIQSAYMMQANGGFNTTAGHDLTEPVSSITNSGSQQQLITANLITLRQNCDAGSVQEPVTAILAAGMHQALAESTLAEIDEEAAETYGLTEEQQSGALRVAAFLMEYYGTGGQWSDLRMPMNTLTTRDRMALVTVYLKGTPYVIVDIALRMLEPRELYNAHDFRPDYIIDRGHDGRRFSKAQQVRMVGNSVPPLSAVGFLKLNAPDLAVRQAA